MTVQLGGREPEFQQWYGERAQRLGLDPNPDAPDHHYDYRAAFNASAEPDESGHWPSEFKRKSHPRTYLDGMDTRTGLPVERLSPSVEGLQPLARDFNPADLNGIWSGLGDELLQALPRAALGAAASVNLLAAPAVRAFGEDAQDRWFATMVDPPLRSLDEIDERSMINGVAARAVGQLGKIALEAPLGPVGVGALEGMTHAAREVQDGESSEKALALGSLTGATMAVGFALPLSLPVKAGFGPALLQRLGFGVGSNVALGAVQRGGEAALGEDARVLDGVAVAMDAALGALFGGAAHLMLRRADADAAMTTIEQASAQRVVPPGEQGQTSLDHLAARVKAEQTGEQPPPDPPVPANVAAVVDEQAATEEAALVGAEPQMAQMELPGVGEPIPLPKVESAKPQETAAPLFRPAGEQTHRGKPLHEMTIEELHAASRAARDDDIAFLTRVFGNEQDAKFFARGSNSTSDAAYDRAQKMVDALPPEKRKLIEQWESGIVDDAEATSVDIDALIRELDILDDSSPDALGRSLRYALTNIGDKTHPSEGMNTRELAAWLMLREANDIIAAKGWSGKEVSTAAIKASASRFYDANDAEFMLQRFLKKPETNPATNKISRLALPKPAAKSESEGPAWNPVNPDGEAVDFDLPALQQTVTQLDALGVKTEDGRSFGDILKEATENPANAAALLDDITRCVLNYGH